MKVVFKTNFNAIAVQMSWINFTLFLLYVTGVQCLHNVSLEVLPDIVERGYDVVLKCHYVLDEPHLYSLKWYRGKHEFYRYSPRENPTTKTFNIAGIEVDMGNSNESQVTIKNVDFSLTGNFSCEVTADAPSFSTESATKKLIVVSLPTTKPTITSERRRYAVGDVLTANCSLPPSRPTVEFSFTLNNSPIRPVQTELHGRDASFLERDSTLLHHETEWQWSQMNLTLQQHHYTNGQLNLRCIAQIPGIFKATTEMQLNAWEPVPERVTSDNSDTLHILGLQAMMIISTIHLICR